MGRRDGGASLHLAFGMAMRLMSCKQQADLEVLIGESEIENDPIKMGQVGSSLKLLPTLDFVFFFFLLLFFCLAYFFTLVSFSLLIVGC